MSESELTIHTDGAARGNPGPAAFAFVIARAGETIAEDHGCLGETTNNVAEYAALVKALERAAQLGARKLVVHSDSELMIKQMRGEYKVRNAALQELYDDAKQLASTFQQVTFQHVRREQNRRADALCNEALDAAKPAEQRSAHKSSRSAQATPRPASLPAPVREEILECLRSVAAVWSGGNPNHPRAEEVWDQLWDILIEAGVVKHSKP